MWEPALSTGICHQLSHRCDPRLSQCGGQGERTALNHPTAAAENRHSNTLSPARRKIRSSFWGRKQGTVFVGFYSIQENKAQGKKGFFLLLEFFYLLFPLAKQSPLDLQHCQATLVKRQWYHLIHPPILVLSGSFTDYQLNSHHAANQKRDQTGGNNIYLGDSQYQQQQAPSL